MNKSISNLTAYKSSSIIFFFLFSVLVFQQGNAQHCFPGFHISANGNTISFSDVSTADGTITAYNWDFGDGHSSTDQNPVHTYAAPGTYNVCLTITAHNPNCTATFCHHVIVVFDPMGVCHAAFAAHQPNLNHPIIEFSDQSTSDGIIGSWFWDFGDGNSSSEQNPSHSYAAPGTYLVCLTITDEDGICTSTLCQHVVVHHQPVAVCQAAFSIHPDPTGLVIQFTNTSTGTTNHTTYLWDFGEGTTSTEENPAHSYVHSGHYIVCLFITDTTTGCTSHSCHMINVHHPGFQQYLLNQVQMEEIVVLKSESSVERSAMTKARLAIYPNPVSDILKIDYQIPNPAVVKFGIYSVSGVEVVTLREGVKPAGEHSEIISVKNLLPAVYVLKITLDGIPQVYRIVVQ